MVKSGFHRIAREEHTKRLAEQARAKQRNLLASNFNNFFSE
jgi:hypothetical protein